MGKKVIKKTYKDTYAAGFKERIEENRFMIRIDLVSMKVLEDIDLLGKHSEIYFKMGGFLHKRRFPDKGVFKLEKNESYVPKEPLNLYTWIVEGDPGKKIEVPFKVFDRDRLRPDQKLISTKLDITLGQGGDYVAFQQNKIKLKLYISANKISY